MNLLTNELQQLKCIHILVYKIHCISEKIRNKFFDEFDDFPVTNVFLIIIFLVYNFVIYNTKYVAICC